MQYTFDIDLLKACVKYVTGGAHVSHSLQTCTVQYQNTSLNPITEIFYMIMIKKCWQMRYIITHMIVNLSIS